MAETFLRKCAEVVTKADQCSDGYDIACFALARALPPPAKEALGQLVERGPIWDGDLVSKADRDLLLNLGLGSKACVKGEQGYQVANYRGWAVWKECRQ